MPQAKRLDRSVTYRWGSVTAMPFCYKCGRELRSDAKFCDACGVSAPLYLPHRSKTARNVVIAIALTLLLYFLITTAPFYVK